MSQQLVSATNGLIIAIDELNQRFKNATMVINDPTTASQMFLAMAKEAGEQSARTVMNEVLAGQQQQINELTKSVVSLTGMVQSLLEAHLTVTHEETVTRKVTQTVTTKQPEQAEKSFTEDVKWVHVPTTSSGNIRWKGTDEMDTEHVIYQVLYELERVQGKKIDRVADMNKSLYVGIKSRMQGIPWEMIVEEARRNARKL